MTEDSASVADKIKKKLHIQSKSGLEKFQVIFFGILLMIVVVMSGIWSLLWSSILVVFRNGVPKTSTLLVASLEGFSLALLRPNPIDHC